MLFAIIIDPLLVQFEATVVKAGHGAVRVCADDIGAALHSLDGLVPCHEIFVEAKAISNLTLKPSKCVLVPLAEKFSQPLAENILSWLRSNLPDWSDFLIQCSAKYLGFMLGPASEATQWAGTIAKWRLRTIEIAGTHAAASVSAFLYNQRAPPVLTYKCQLLPLPAQFRRIEKAGLHQLYHLATNSLDAAGPFVLAAAGGPKVTSCFALAYAVAVCTARKTLPQWPALKKRLVAAAEEHLPLQLWHDGCVSPPCWDSQPFVMHLATADQGFPSHPEVRRAVEAARREPVCQQFLNGNRSKICIQKIVYQKIVVNIHTNTLHILFAKRLRDNVPVLRPIIDDIEWSAVLRTMRSLGSHCAMCVFKTFVNAWTTSRRFHEAVLATCILGCDAEDNLAHYLVCKRMWKAVKSSVREPVGCTVQERLGLAQNPKKRMQELAIAFTIFHTVKHGEHSLFLEALRTRNYFPLAAAVKSIARTAAASFGRAN